MYIYAILQYNFGSAKDCSLSILFAKSWIKVAASLVFKVCSYEKIVYHKTRIL